VKTFDREGAVKKARWYLKPSSIYPEHKELAKAVVELDEMLSSAERFLKTQGYEILTGDFVRRDGSHGRLYFYKKEETQP
jgi:hypothetical protein